MSPCGVVVVEAVEAGEAVRVGDLIGRVEQALGRISFPGRRAGEMVMMVILVATGVTEEVTVDILGAVEVLEGVAGEVAVGVDMEVVTGMVMKTSRTLWTSQTHPASLL